MVPKKEAALWQDLEFASRIVAEAEFGPDREPTEFAQEVVASALQVATVTARALKPTPGFRRQAREHGQWAVNEDTDLEDFDQRASGFGDGVYPGVEAAIAVDRRRLIGRIRVDLGHTAIALGLRQLGITTQDSLQAFLDSEVLPED